MNNSGQQLISYNIYIYIYIYICVCVCVCVCIYIYKSDSNYLSYGATTFIKIALSKTTFSMTTCSPEEFSVSHRMRLCQPPNGSTSPKYKLLRFKQ